MHTVQQHYSHTQSHYNHNNHTAITRQSQPITLQSQQSRCMTTITACSQSWRPQCPQCVYRERCHGIHRTRQRVKWLALTGRLFVVDVCDHNNDCYEHLQDEPLTPAAGLAPSLLPCPPTHTSGHNEAVFWTRTAGYLAPQVSSACVYSDISHQPRAPHRL